VDVTTKESALVRRGTDLDVARLAWDNTTSQERWEEILEDQARGRADLVVVEVEGAVVATILVDLVRGRLWNVMVHPSRRRGGLGSVVMQVGEKRLKEAGFERAELFVRLDNKPARRFYSALGYNQVGVETLTWYGDEVFQARCALLVRRLD
jgi:ribosomal protein S18 acetylase RimI-like enzyme